jgi:hypothetical protein
MATENATERHTTANEEEPVVAMHWQSGDSNNNGSNNSGSYESPEDELSYLLHKRGAQKCSTILVAELGGFDIYQGFQVGKSSRVDKVPTW